MKRKAIVGGAVKGKADSPQQGSRDELLRESHVRFGPQQHGERMAALVQAQRRLASTEATPEELMDSIPDLALSVVHATGAIFELLDGDAVILRSGTEAAVALDALDMRLPLRGSLTGEAIRLNRTMRCDDTETDPRVALEVSRKFGVRSVLVTVVRDRSGPVGALKLFDFKPARFGAADSDSLELLAEALGAVIQRKRAKEDAQRSIRIQAGIVQMQHQIASSSAGLQTALDLIVERAQELTGATGAAVVFVDGDDMVYRAVSGTALGRLGHRVRLEGSLVGLSVAHEELLRCDDAETDPCVNREACRELAARSVVAVPLHAGDTVTGALKVFSGRTHAFAQLDVGTLQILSEWLGVVMQRHAAAEQLRSSESQYRLMFAAHSLPMWVYDMETLRFLAVNDAAIRQYGYTEAEFLSMTIRDITPPAAGPSLDRHLAARGQGPQTVANWEHRRRDGVVIDVEMAANSIRFGDRPARLVLAHDITERKRAERRLEKSEALLNIAGRAARVGGWSLDLRERTLSWSDELCAMHDLPPSTLCTVEQAINFYAPESRATMVEAMNGCRDDGTSYDLEVECITAGGRRIWVRTIGQAVRDSTGAIIGAQGALQDISEKKQSEENARALATRLTTTLESIKDAFYTVDRDWRFTYVNSEAERLFQRSRVDLMGRVLWEAISDLFGGEFERRHREAVTRNSSVAFEAYYAPCQQWFEAHAYPSEDGLTVYLRDVSERRLAQEALRSMNENLETKVAERTLELELTNSALVGKEEKMRSVVEHMADGVITFSDDGIIRSANSKVEAIFGHAPSALVGRSVSVLIPALDVLVAATATGGNPDAEGAIARIGREPYGTHENGDCIDLDVAISDYRIGGQRLWTAILRDIGERVRIVADLEQARLGAEEASRAKSAFVATMSHEIRTPMNGVIGMIDVLHQTELAPDQARILGVARDSAHALLAIIEDILDFSKIEAGKIELEREPISVARVVEKACELVSGVAGGNGVELAVDVDPLLPAAVWGDAGRLRQVLVNLLSNAIKFSNGRVAARVSVRARLTEGSADRVNVQLDIEDNGIGMDAATVERLFMPFSQADVSTTRRFGGTGLGLAISHHLTGLMGGCIDVHSTPDVGSVFTLRLPFFVAPADLLPTDIDHIGAAPRRSAEAGDARAESSHPARPVLVAEDNKINQQVIIEQLKRLGYQAEVVANGREALALWRQGGFGALLTDLQMPEMDGYELTTTIRTEEDDRTRIPIIALTANALKDEASRCKAAGMDGYLTKPVQMAALDEMLKRWLGHGAAGTAPAVEPSSREDTCASPLHGQRTAPVDATVLPSLVGDDAAVLGEFMLDFLEGAVRAATELANALAAGHVTSVGAVAHRLKSSARAVGALHLGELCDAIERDANAAADCESLTAMQARFDAELARVREWIDAQGWNRAPALQGAEAE
jgi:PAS domain S-box-containing protein